MSIQDEADLRAQMSGLLDAIEVRPAPAAATIQRGKRIRTGRRVLVAAGLAAAAVLAAVLPGALTGRTAGPVTARHYSVTVNVLGPVAHGGVIAEGTDNGKPWKVVASGPAASPTIQAVGAIGAGTSGTGEEYLEGPITTQVIGDSRYNTIVGNVSAAVSSVVIQLPDGERPTLTPVSWGGVRWVAVVVPAGVPIVRAVAYSGARELVYAVPFRGTEFVAWRRPGQVGPARMTKPIGAGVVDGHGWSARVSVGPWGWCVVTSAASACSAVAPTADLKGQPVSMWTCSPATGTTPATGIAFAAPDVRRVVLQFGGGRSASFRPVNVAGTWIFGYAIPAHSQVIGTREYGARGQIVGSTRGQAVSSEATPGWSCNG